MCKGKDIFLLKSKSDYVLLKDKLIAWIDANQSFTSIMYLVMVKEIGQHNSNISQYNSNISQFSNSNCSIMKIGSDDAKSSEITDENDLNGAIKKSKFLSSKKIPISHESIDLEPIKDIDYNTGDSQKNNKRNLLS